MRISEMNWMMVEEYLEARRPRSVAAGLHGTTRLSELKHRQLYWPNGSLLKRPTHWAFLSFPSWLTGSRRIFARFRERSRCEWKPTCQSCATFLTRWPSTGSNTS